MFLYRKPDLFCEVSPTKTPADGNCLLYGIHIFNISSAIIFIFCSAIINGLQDNDAFKHVSGDNLNESWVTLMKDLKFWEGMDDHVMYLRRRWVLGSFEWMSGMHNSKSNDKMVLDYTDDEWTFIWSTMIDGALAVPDIKDDFGNILKHNYAPELFIKFLAHDLHCNIIIFDMLLDQIQFFSGNHLKSHNVVFKSPLLLYYTGSHYQSVFQRDHDFFITFSKKLEQNPSPNGRYEDTQFSNKADELSPVIGLSNEKQGVTREESKDQPFKTAYKKSKHELDNKSPTIKRKKYDDEKENHKEKLLLSNRFHCLSPNKESVEEEEYPEINMNEPGKIMKENKDEDLNCQETCLLTLQDLKLIKAKNRTDLQKKRYKHLMYILRKEKLNTEQKDKIRKENAEQQAKARATKREANEQGYKESIAAEKFKSRASQRETDEKGFKKDRTNAKSKERASKREADEKGFKKTRADEKSKTRLNRVNTEEKRRRLFINSIKKGRIFECVSCHRKLFENGVVMLEDKIKEQIQTSFSTTFELAIGKIETRMVDGFHHICLTCKMYTGKGKIPPMCVKNNLQLFDISGHEELKLTELENCLIALNIIFQKVYQLPKSRWPAMKDRTVNIPIYESDVLKTVQSLPRTPSEAGIIPINFKRKLSYKQSHKTQYVSVEKILKALETLKNLGNPHYQFVPDFFQFKEKCKEKDTEGFNFLFQDENQNETNEGIGNNEEYEQEENHQKDIEEDKDSNIELNTSEEDDLKEEEEYRTKDSVKKWQFEYNRSTCFSNNYPEINYKEDTSEEFSVAPGEGKLPSNILEEKDWDLKSFPCLHPDGQNNLHSKRSTKLDDQQYFNQRILNKDTRFAECPAYIFAAIAYIEKKQIERNKGISFQRGKCEKGDDGTLTYTLNDPYSVLDNIKNTPRYWQKARYELIARLENLGPFTFFFTLSCADLRWPENFTALLQDHVVKYEYEDGIDTVTIDGQKLEDYLTANESKHEFIKKNLLNATLTFHHRVKMFIKYIVMSKGNEMAIKYNSY